MKTIVLTVLTAATLALAGCAVDPSSSDPESQDATHQASVAGDRANVAFTHDEVGIGGRGGVVLANDPQRRMYDFDKAPRIGQRSPYEISLTEINALAAVPHTATSDGRDVERRQESNADTTGPKP